MFSTKTLTAIAAALVCATPAWAADKLVQLNFEGLTVLTDGARNDVSIDDYYNGGQVKSTSSPFGAIGGFGPDYDVVISGGLSIVGTESLLNLGNGSFVADLGIGGTGALGLNGTADGASTAIIDFVDGSSFNGQLSFYFAAAGSAPLSVTVEGVDSQTFTFGGNQTCAGVAAFCHWQLASFDLGPHSGVTRVSLTGDGVLIDNLTLGSTNPANLPVTPAVPEPSSYALMVFGLAAVGLAARRRQRRG